MFFGEIWAGLKINTAMVFSIVIVTFISMTLVGVSALLHLQITEMKGLWYDSAQVLVYLCTDCFFRATLASGVSTRRHLKK